MKVLVILAHPRGRDTLCGALAEAFSRGAVDAGCVVLRLDLHEIDFDRDVLSVSPRQQHLEPGLVQAQEAIVSSDHIVLVYPTWWGSFPGMLKSFFDRILVPGWAFEEISGGTGYAGLLSGRTAELITTMDTPAAVYRFLYRAPGRNAISRATLGFCGIDVVRHSTFSSVKNTSAERRARWLKQADDLGRRLSKGPRTTAQLLSVHVGSWLTALRLQFYPMTFFAYWLGALVASPDMAIQVSNFWLGYAFLFALEASTVFSNELFDQETDRQNANWGPFNGGSRVLATGRLAPGALAAGAVSMGAVAAVLAALSVSLSSQSVTLTVFFLVYACLALGYTLPPLRLSYRMLGEIDVGVTHSFMAVLAGYLMQDGPIGVSTPWMISVPLCLSILPAIILSGIPDRDADQAAGKRTIAVVLGNERAYTLSTVLAAAAWLSMVAIEVMADTGQYGIALPLVVFVHSGWLVYRVWQEKVRDPSARRIDGTMMVALSFILWFCIPPLWIHS